MAFEIIPGFVYAPGSRDEDSHRTYKVTFKVRGAKTDGPANLLQTPGLPVYGDQWLFDDDVDVWAFCRWPAEFQPTVNDGVNIIWLITFTFSTKPDKNYCLENQIDDPLLKPPEVSGGWVKYTEESVQDRFGNPLVNSAWEQIRGPQVEFDKNRDQVHIEMPVPQLNLGFVQQFKDCVNLYPIWGMNYRTVKLSGFRWKKNYYGVCFPYYTWIFDFDLNAEGFDRDTLDEGTKVLNGHWDATTGNWILDPIGGSPPDPTNPQHFIRFQDRVGNVSRVILDGHGLPAGVFIGTGTGAEACYLCSGGTTPNQVTLAGQTSGGGDAIFTSEYFDYNQVLDQVLNATNGNYCLFTYTADTGVFVQTYFYSQVGSNFATVEVTFGSVDESTPGAVYRILVKLSGGTINCSTARKATLVTGDADSCPPVILITPSGSPPSGPPFSGGPGIIHVEKYNEADFSLLGIPLNL